MHATGCGLLGLYTGCRINELAGLHVEDVKTDAAGIQYLDINADHAPDGTPSGKRLKNAGSARLVPLHSTIAEPFLPYVAGLKQAGQARVFPMWKAGRDGYGQAASRWFQRHRKLNGLPNDFHSLRHTVSTALREASVPEDVVAELLGHSFGKSMSFGRYAKQSSLPKLRDAVEQLRY